MSPAVLPSAPLPFVERVRDAAADERPDPEFVTREALRLLSSWDDAGNPEQYIDDVRIDLAVEVVARTYQRAKERTR